MIFFRKILFPFAILYGCITHVRNFLYDSRIFRSYAFDVPIIAVGNLSVGGTGKTPQIEYLIRLLSQKYKVATLSRGYKRQSKGFILADEFSSVSQLGDEPYQFYKQFPNIKVAVDVDRKNGIEQLLSLPLSPDVILLDDAFQHRKVRAGFYILLTSYDDLFCNDFILPMGNLRESRSGAKRADIIIVTKCPEDISQKEQESIKHKIGLNQPIFFSSIAYDENIYSLETIKKVSEIRKSDKLLVAGIAKPESFFAYLQNENDILLKFSDHHHFSDEDILNIKKQAKNNLIITTEKDFVRLERSLPKEQLFYLPIKTAFIFGSNDFDKTILNYVGKSPRNS